MIGALPGLDIHWGLGFGVVFCVAMHVLVRGTTYGFALRIVGGNVRAARLAGLPGAVVDRARATGHTPILAEALALQATLLADTGDVDAAIKVGHEATYAAEAGHHDEVLARVRTRLVHWLGYVATREAEALAMARQAQATIDRLSRNYPNPMAGLLPGTSLNGANVSFARLMYAYQQFGNVSTTTSQGYSWYHSAQTRVERRFSRGFTILGAWTWSKNMEAVGFLNASDPMPERVISANDRTHRFTASGIYELPFGPGKALLGSSTGALARFVEGWQMTAIYTAQSGIPIDITGALLSNSKLFGQVLPVVGDDAQSELLLVGLPVAGTGYDVPGFARDLADFQVRYPHAVAVAAPQPSVRAEFAKAGVATFAREGEAIDALHQLACAFCELARRDVGLVLDSLHP